MGDCSEAPAFYGINPLITLKFISCDCDHRCTVVKCCINNFVLLLFNIYFPCCDNSLEYKDEINYLSGFIEHVLN